MTPNIVLGSRAPAVAPKCSPVIVTIAAAAPRITTVRTNVAKSELTFSMPTLAKIAVSAANTAERSAQLCQLPRRFTAAAIRTSANHRVAIELEEGGGVDADAFARLAARLSWVAGDYRNRETFDRLREALGPAQHPLCYLAIPPSLFGAVASNLARSGCAVGSLGAKEPRDVPKRCGYQLLHTPQVFLAIRDREREMKKKGKKIGICGQAPSDFPDFAEFLVECGIDSISLNSDSVIKTRLLVAEKEKALGR